MNTLKVTHIFTLGALVYGTYIRFSRDGLVCSCNVYPIPESKRDDLIESTCFGSYTNLYEYLIYILWGLFIVFGLGIAIFFCTNACKNCREKIEEEDTYGTDNTSQRPARTSTSIQEETEDNEEPLLIPEPKPEQRPTVASNNTPRVGMHTIHEDPDETNYTRYSKSVNHGNASNGNNESSA